MCLKYCWMYGKQCRLRSDTTFCSVWSGSTLFAMAYLSQYLGILRYTNIHVKFFPLIHIWLNAVFLSVCSFDRFVFCIMLGAALRQKTRAGCSEDQVQAPNIFTGDHSTVILLLQFVFTYLFCVWLSSVLCCKFVCMCWSFTAQSTWWGHVELGQFT